MLAAFTERGSDGEVPLPFLVLFAKKYSGDPVCHLGSFSVPLFKAVAKWQLPGVGSFCNLGSFCRTAFPVNPVGSHLESGFVLQNVIWVV